MIASRNPASDADVENATDKEASRELDVEKAVEQKVVEQQTPEAPYSVFGEGTKIWIIILVSFSALISPFAATMFLPALTVIADALGVTPTKVNLSLTTFMVCMNEFIDSVQTKLGRLVRPG